MTCARQCTSGCVHACPQIITPNPQIDGSAGDLGSDVGSTEALLATHRELKEAVDGEREEVDKFVGIGRGLIEEENCDKDAVRYQ